MTNPLAEADPWISQPRPDDRPTEIFLPVAIGITPVWAYQEKAGRWGAYIIVPGTEMGEDCEHMHVTQDEAWTCAETMARTIAAWRLSQMGGR